MMVVMKKTTIITVNSKTETAAEEPESSEIKYVKNIQGFLNRPRNGVMETNVGVMKLVLQNVTFM